MKETLKTSFKDRELTYWLLEKNQEMINYYNEYPNSRTPPSTRVENRLERVKANVKDLTDLGLMREVGTAPAEKGGTRAVQLYGYTSDGHLLALVIESFCLSAKKPMRKPMIFYNRC